MTSFDDLTNDALARLRADNEPTRLAAGWVVAVQHTSMTCWATGLSAPVL